MIVPTWKGKRAIPIVSACMTRAGLPSFALNTVEVTAEEAADGVHFYLVEAELLEAGYEEPFVHFPDMEAPSFLHPAVCEYLGLDPVLIEPIFVTVLEEALMSRIIEVIVSPTGETTVQTKGYSGSDCFQASQFLEQALGIKTNDRPSPEFYASLTQAVEAQQ